MYIKIYVFFTNPRLFETNEFEFSLTVLVNKRLLSTGNRPLRYRRPKKIVGNLEKLVPRSVIYQALG